MGYRQANHARQDFARLGGPPLSHYRSAQASRTSLHEVGRISIRLSQHQRKVFEIDHGEQRTSHSTIQPRRTRASCNSQAGRFARCHGTHQHSRHYIQPSHGPARSCHPQNLLATPQGVSMENQTQTASSFQ